MPLGVLGVVLFLRVLHLCYLFLRVLMRLRLQGGMAQVMVFFSSCASVKYHAELLNFIDLPVKDIHGKQKQQRRTTTFMDFCKVPPLIRARRAYFSALT